MENFEFKSTVCTSKEQSEKLLALGLKKETADMYYPMELEDELPEIADSFFGPVINSLPAWSLHRLIEMYGDNYSFFSLVNAYGELIHAIAIDIENGDFNKDYLENEIK